MFSVLQIFSLSLLNVLGTLGTKFHLTLVVTDKLDGNSYTFQEKYNNICAIVIDL